MQAFTTIVSCLTTCTPLYIWPLGPWPSLTVASNLLPYTPYSVASQLYYALAAMPAFVLNCLTEVEFDEEPNTNIFVSRNTWLGTINPLLPTHLTDF